MWGLEGAQRSGFLARSGEIILEVVEYHSHVGRPRRADYLPSDQGIVNVAVSSRDPQEVAAIIERSKAAGLVPPYVLDKNGIIAGYLLDAGRELELVSFPDEMDTFLGFTPPPNPFLASAV